MPHSTQIRTRFVGSGVFDENRRLRNDMLHLRLLSERLSYGPVRGWVTALAKNLHPLRLDSVNRNKVRLDGAKLHNTERGREISPRKRHRCLRQQPTCCDHASFTRQSRNVHIHSVVTTHTNRRRTRVTVRVFPSRRTVSTMRSPTRRNRLRRSCIAAVFAGFPSIDTRVSPTASPASVAGDPGTT